MTGVQVDEFASQLAKELSLLSREEQHEILVRIGRMESRMRADGQDRPIWRGPVPEAEILGSEVVIPTDQGERRGRAVAFGIVRAGTEYERSVVVYSAASGTNHEAPGSQVRKANQSESERIRDELAMAERLKEATSGVQARSETRRAPARKKWEPDPGLIDRMVAIAKDSNTVSSVEEVGGCHKVTGRNRERRMYIFKKGLRVDVSGFEPTVDEGVIRISAEEAKRAHLGKVRAQVDFTSQTIGMRTFELLLKELG